MPSLNCRTRRGVMACGKSTSRKSTPVQLRRERVRCLDMRANLEDYAQSGRGWILGRLRCLDMRANLEDYAQSGRGWILGRLRPSVIMRLLIFNEMRLNPVPF